MIGRFLLGPRPLQKSLTASTALLVLVLMGATLLVVQWRVARTLREGLEARGLSIAQSIGALATPSLFAYNYAALQMAATGASADTGAAYVVIHDKEGNVAGAAGRVSAPIWNRHGTPPRLHGPSVREVNVSDSRGGREEFLEIATPVRVEGVHESWGTVRVGMSVAPVVAELRRIGLGLIALGLALALAAVACGRWVARRITAPLRQLAAGTEALSKGDMNHHISVKGAKELTDLAAAFNLMTARVKEKARESSDYQEALRTLNATLEQQVQERTRALQASEAQYKSLVENSPDAILIVQQRHVRFINPAFLEIFGFERAAVDSPDFRLDSLFESPAAAMVRGRIDAWERGDSAIPTEVLGTTASGQILHLQLRGSYIEYGGEPAAECILIDMTEAKRLREHITETEKLRSLGELAGGVAHDFNNLLGAILGRVQLLRRRGLADSIDEELSVIETAARDGRDTVRRIQDFARTRTRGREEPIDIGEIIRGAVEMTSSRWTAEANLHDVRIDVKLDSADVPPVLGNASELREVFTNLILNSVDAMPGEVA